MTQKLVISAIGPDRVGLIERISKYVIDCNCNIEDSSMAVFCGEFAGIFLIAGSEQSLSEITAKTDELEQQTGLTIFTRKPSERRGTEDTIPYVLTASSLDHPGIVYRLTRTLSEAGINIDAMETKHYYAPTSGAPMFRFEAEISIPSHINLPRLRAHFQQIGEEENIDIELSSRGNR